jgi:hypothetical protein
VDAQPADTNGTSGTADDPVSNHESDSDEELLVEDDLEAFEGVFDD